MAIATDRRLLSENRITHNSDQSSFAYELLTEGEVARILRLSVFKLQQDRSKGRGLTYVRLGKRTIRYRRSDVCAFIDAAARRSL